MESLSKELFNKRIATNLRILAKKKGFCISQLEYQMNCSTGYISRMENQKSVINAYSLYQAMLLLDVGFNELLKDMEVEILKEKAEELGYELIKKGE